MICCRKNAQIKSIVGLKEKLIKGEKKYILSCNERCKSKQNVDVLDENDNQKQETEKKKFYSTMSIYLFSSIFILIISLTIYYLLWVKLWFK